jgi:hypothetical protein
MLKLLSLAGDILDQAPSGKRLISGALMLKDKYKTMRLSAVERNIDHAIQRVYDAYGTDLSAFFKKVQRESQAQAPGSPDPSTPKDRDKERHAR